MKSVGVTAPSPARRWAGMAASVALGAAGVLLLLYEPEAAHEHPAYASQLAFGHTLWIAACGYAAALVAPGIRGTLAAIVGVALAAVAVVGQAASESATIAAEAFWRNLMYAGLVIEAGVIVIAAQALAYGMRELGRRGRAAWLLLAPLLVLGGLAAALLVAPPGPNLSPTPAPTAPTAPEPAPTAPGTP